jgi:hypothetical protein
MITTALKFLSLGLFIELLLIFGFPYQVKSEVEVREIATPERMIFQENFDPPGDGKPKDTVGAGSRDNLKCSQDEQPIRSLMPKQNYGLTLQEHPTIFVYLPNTSAKQVVLTFQDEAGNYSERVFLAIASRSGIANFKLPDKQPPLAVGKNYQWSLAIVCGETLQPSDPVFRGWVQRVARTAELERQLQQKSVIEQMQWYSKNGYWYDWLEVMVQAKRAQPNDPKVSSQWREMLQLVGLGAIASEVLN